MTIHLVRVHLALICLAEGTKVDGVGRKGVFADYIDSQPQGHIKSDISTCNRTQMSSI